VEDLVGRWPVDGAAGARLRDRLIEAYGDPGRGYHDLRHLREVLGHLDGLLRQPVASSVDRLAVVLAAWFHDAVYDGGPDDEERSAALAEASLPQVGLAPAVVAEVARLVRMTRDHRPDPGDRAGAVLCDADLAILASSPERYDEYVHDVRREYASLDETTFRRGRAAVLRALLSAPSLFHTPAAQEEWERAARANVTRELAALGPDR
jgi:predicted metal-dependent HD superfamily phosphohydrolase